MPIIETTAELVARTYAEMEARLEVVRGRLESAPHLWREGAPRSSG